MRNSTVVSLSKEFEITSRFSFVPEAAVRFNTDEGTELEAEAALMYEVNERISAGLFYNYDDYEGSDDHSVGVGLSIQLGSRDLTPSMPGAGKGVRGFFERLLRKGN